MGVLRHIFFCLLFILISVSGHGQLGGRAVYEFLNLPMTRAAGLGGKSISVMDGDVNTLRMNPSLFNAEHQNKLAINFTSYLADVNWGSTYYALKSKDSLNYWGVGLTYLNYGDFVEANELGEITGTFKAADYAGVITYARKLDSNFVVGANLKPVFSALESYRSFGVVLDLSISHYWKKHDLSSSLIVRNIGTQITAYTSGNYEPLPFEIQLTASKKLTHAPFRFYGVLHNLQRFDYTYELEEQENENLFGEQEQESSKVSDFGDKLMRHVVLGIEFVPFKSFQARFAYNYQRQKEMIHQQKVGLIGFSWGLTLNLKKIRIDYGRAFYHLAGSSNHFTLTANLNKFGNL